MYQQLRGGIGMDFPKAVRKAPVQRWQAVSFVSAYEIPPVEHLISSVRTPGPEACTRARHVRDSARADPTMKNDRDFIQAVDKAVTQACR